MGAEIWEKLDRAISARGVCDDLEIDVRVFVCAEQNILTSSGAADAMSQVDRKLFVPDPRLAYKDAPQVIGK